MASPIESRPFVRSVRRSASTSFDFSQVSVPRVLVAVAMTAFLAIGLTLLERRLVGALANSLSQSKYVMWMFLAGVFCGGLKFAVESIPPRLSQPASSGFGVINCGLLTLFAWAVFPQSWNWFTLLGTLCWLTVLGWFCCSRGAVLLCQIRLNNHIWPVVSEFFLRPAISPRFSEFGRELEDSDARYHSAAAPSTEVRVLKLAAVPDSDDAADFLKFSNPSRDTVQPEVQAESGAITSQMVRRIEANGDDVLEAHATAVFPEGTRQAVLHIPFTPAFAETPHVECEVADGSEIRLKMGAIFPYGARVELKRSGEDLDELAVSVDLFAVHTVLPSEK